MEQNTTQPSQQQAEALIRIGGYLHEVREGKLLSLEQVSTQTMIQARLLRAIETADFHQLPEPIYIRGFIRRYAEALGLNGSEVASQFPVDLNKNTIQPSWDQSTTQLRPTHLWLAYTIIIVVAIGGLHQYLTRFSTPAGQSNNTIESSEDSVNTPTDDPSITASNDASSNSSNPSNPTSITIPAEPPPEEIESDSPLKVTIELTQRSWLRVIVDGQQELEEVLPEGTQRSWTGAQQITIRAGNAGGVLLARDNSEAELMGDPGSVEEVTFSVDAQDASSSNGGNSSAIGSSTTTTSQATSQ